MEDDIMKKIQLMCLNPLHCGAVVASREAEAQERKKAESQSPSLRGSGRFNIVQNEPDLQGVRSQSPSLRGSGRFMHTRHPGRAGVGVSIPFIAGQWSLPVAPNVAAAEAGSLNPLHCGAVVASAGRSSDLRRSPQVSIPFIAGQWSLPSRSTTGSRSKTSSQSPSLRGSGRFPTAPCRRPRWSTSQSPSLRGSGRFRSCLRNPARLRQVSIPFIAGQWSLPAAGTAKPPGPWCLNPLHCGAVVASASAALAVWRAAAGLNPLHCGAVVASVGAGRLRCARRMVSIPFIAGQWSLQAEERARKEAADRSQSPSLRGSGRFLMPIIVYLRVIGRSQSPSLRGSGRFRLPPPKGGGEPFGLNPLHCGAVVASETRRRPRQRRRKVSIPFIAGQWSLRCASAVCS